MRRLLTITILCVALSGCSMQITGKGLQTSIGNARAATCTELETQAEQDECHEARGGELSEAGGNLLQQALSPIAILLKLLSGVGAAT